MQKIKVVKMTENIIWQIEQNMMAIGIKVIIVKANIVTVEKYK